MAPATYLTPGIYVEEISTGAKPIEAVGTSTAAFVGRAPDLNAPPREAVAVNNWSQFVKEFVGGEGRASTDLSNAVFGFFQNGGSRCYVVNVGRDGSLVGDGRRRQGLDLLEEVDEVAIVAAPGFHGAADYDALLSQCERLMDRVAVLDAPPDVTDLDSLKQVAVAEAPAPGGAPGPVSPPAGRRPRNSTGGYGAFYFPYVTIRDPLAPANLINVPPSGHVAGIYARTDATRGVHKAPANENVRGAVNVTYRVTHQEPGELNRLGVNCIRPFPQEGIRVWGARTLADSGEWRYLNVRRLFNMIEKSIARSTRWIVFEPNDTSLWKSIRRDVSAFLTLLWRQGALMGASPEEAFFVQC